MRPIVVALALAMAWAGLGLAQSDVPVASLQLVAAPDVSATPSSYVTLLFSVRAPDGARLDVVLPDDSWRTTSQGRSLAASSESSVVPITVGIPPLAPANFRAPITVRAVGADADVVEATTFIEVERLLAFDVQIPNRIDAEERDDIPFAMLVSNRSNVRDSFALSVDDARLSLSTNRVELEPGESAAIEGRFAVSNDDRRRRGFLVEVRVTSQSDAAVSEAYLVQFRMPDLPRFAGPPALSVTAAWTTTARATFGADVPTQASLATGLSPGLEGALSDFVRLDASTSDLEFGTTGIRLPSSLEFALSSESWLLSSSIGDAGLAAAYEATTPRVRAGVGLASDLASSFEASASIALLGDLPALGLSAGVLFAEEAQAQEILVRYRLPIDLFSLTLAAGVAGSSTVDAPTYRVTPLLRQSFGWGTQTIYVSQQLQAAPFSGRWDVNLAAGTRTSRPIGGRLTARLTLEGVNTTVALGAVVTSTPIDGVFLSGNIGYQSRAGEEPFSALRSGASASASVRLASATLGASGSYRRLDVLEGTLDAEEAYGASLSVATGPFGVGASVGLERATGPQANARTEEITVDGRIAIRPAFATTLEASANYSVDRITTEAELGFGAAWDQRWSRDLSSRLVVERSDDVSTTGREVRDEANIELDWERAFGWDEANFAMDYSVRLPGGIGSASSAPVHAIGASFALRFENRLRTPQGVVQLFGGRIGGTVQGRVFLDHDLSGTFTAGDEPLTATRIAFAEDTVALSDDQGRYAAAVPEGRYTRLLFPDLSASITRVVPEDLVVARDETYDLDLALAPSTSLRVTVVDDLDRDGMAGENEPPRSGAGVVASGPVRRTAVSGVDGVAIVTGLVEGEYRIEIDPTRVPPRYEATSEAIFVSAPPGNPGTLTVTMAERPREVVTTFRPGDLGVFASIDPRRPNPGDVATIEARVQGVPSEVLFEIFGTRVPLVLTEGVWRGEWTVPDELDAGRYDGVVRAISGDTETEKELRVIVREP